MSNDFIQDGRIRVSCRSCYALSLPITYEGGWESFEDAAAIAAEGVLGWENLICPKCQERRAREEKEKMDYRWHREDRA